MRAIEGLVALGEDVAAWKALERTTENAFIDYISGIQALLRVRRNRDVEDAAAGEAAVGASWDDVARLEARYRLYSLLTLAPKQMEKVRIEVERLLGICASQSALYACASMLYLAICALLIRRPQELNVPSDTFLGKAILSWRDSVIWLLEGSRGKFDEHRLFVPSYWLPPHAELMKAIYQASCGRTRYACAAAEAMDVRVAGPGVLVVRARCFAADGDVERACREYRVLIKHLEKNGLNEAALIFYEEAMQWGI